MLTIEQRLSRLEGSARRWRSGCICALLCLIGTWSIGADPDPFANPDENLKINTFEEIHCRKLVVDNKDGKPRVLLTAKGNSGIIGIIGSDKVMALSSEEEGDQKAMDIAVWRLADNKSLFKIAAGSDTQALGLGTPDANYSIALARMSNQAALMLTTLGKPVVVFNATNSGGFGHIDNMDADTQILSLSPHGAATTTKAETERAAGQPGNK